METQFGDHTTMDRSNFVRLLDDEITAANLQDAPIYGPDDETIGTVAHTRGSGPSSEIIVDVGGFLGIGSKRIAIPAGAVDLMRDASYQVTGMTSWSKEQLMALPEHQD